MNDDREGLGSLREAIEEVARELETRPEVVRARRRLLPWAVAACAAVIALAAWLSWLRPAPEREVEVLVLKVRGRPVPARIVEGVAPSTIIILPQRQTGAASPLATTVVVGGGP